MKRIFVLFFTLISISCYAQTTLDDINKLYNGLKDGRESGVDCISNCNGNSCITFNGKNYCTGVILSASTNDKIYATENSEQSHLNLNFRFFQGDQTKWINISFYPIDYFKMLPQKVKLKIKAEEDYPLLNMKTLAPSFGISIYKGGGNITTLTMRKFKKKTNEGAYIEIVNVNNIERLINGKFEIIGETIDGTPVNINGTFENVSY